MVGLAVLASAAEGSETGDARRKVAEAVKALDAGQYAKALEGFSEGAVMFPDSPELAYDRGIAHYRLREFDKAREAFNKALTTRDARLEEKVKFNLGNCAYAEALEKLTSLQEAIDKCQSAISFYRDALELDPLDADARANIETAQLLIKDLLDKKKKEEEEKQKNNPQSQPSSQPQSQPSSQPQSQPSSQPSGQQQKEQKQQDEKDKQQGEQQQQQKQESQEGKQQPAEARRMSPEEAERLLQAVRDKESKRREELRARQPAGRAPVDKDW